MGRGLGPLLAGTGQRAGQGTGPGGRHRVGVWCTPAASRGREGVLAGWALGLVLVGEPAFRTWSWWEVQLEAAVVKGRGGGGGEEEDGKAH